MKTSRLPSIVVRFGAIALSACLLASCQSTQGVDKAQQRECEAIVSVLLATEAEP